MSQLLMKLFVLSISVLLNFGTVAFADDVQCLEITPSASGGKNPYAPISVRELTIVEYNNIKALLSSLGGSWRGISRETSCNLTDASEQTVVQYTINATADLDYHGEFLVEMEFYSSKERTSHQKMFRLYLHETQLRINHDNGTGDVELIQITKNNIGLRYRQLLPNKTNKGGIKKEYFLSLKAGVRAFSIHQRTYTQGRLSDEHEWLFNRE